MIVLICNSSASIIGFLNGKMTVVTGDIFFNYFENEHRKIL